MTPGTPADVGLPDGFLIDLAVNAGGWPDEDDLEALCRRALVAAFSRAALACQPGSELSLVFTDDAAIRELNKTWRDKDKPTNVLSFPASEPDGDLYGPMLGDIVFARETIAREAVDMAIEFDAHLTHLVVHGILHLFDYDHQEEDEAEVMETLERAILADLGLDDPYADRPLTPDEGH